MDPLGIIGIVLSLGIAFWEHMKARRAEEELRRTLETLPSRIAENVSRYLSGSPTTEDTSLTEIADSDRMTRATYADLDNDGKEELLVQFPVGARASAIQVYGRREGEFKLIAEWGTDTPAEFDIKDVDGDGRLEVGTLETSQVADVPYAWGLRDEVWYRLEGNHFVQVLRVPPPQEDIDVALRELCNETE